MIRNHSTQVNDIEQGKYDWMQNPPPADRYAEVKDKYEGTQFRVEPTISTYYFWMNTTQAAVRRPQGAPGGQLRGRPGGAGTDLRRPDHSTHQILPPGMPGYKKFDLYPHDMAKAKS